MMSKRIVALVCITALLMTLLAACGGKKQVINGIQVEEQKIENQYSDGIVLLMTNKTNNDCDMEVTITFLDANGNKVDSYDNFKIYACAKDATIAQPFYSSKPFVSYNYNVTPQAMSLYRPIDTDLKAEVKQNGEDVTVTVTNNGTETAHFVEYYTLYYKGGKLIGVGTGYCDDDKDELKPGASISDQDHCYDPYDKVSVYVHSKIDPKQ